MKNKNPIKKFKHSNIIFTVFLVLLFFAIIQSLNSSATKEVELSYDEFTSLLVKDSIDGIASPAIKKAEIVKKENNIYEFKGLLKGYYIYRKDSLAAKKSFFNKKIKFNRFKVILPMITEEMTTSWTQKGFEYKFSNKEFDWVSVIVSFLPWLFFIGLWVLMIRHMGSGGAGGGSKGVFGFGKSKAKLVSDDLNVTFDDVAGCDEAKEELSEVIDFLKTPEKYIELGGKIPKGILLVGSPGTGKTLLAKAVAGEAKVPFFSIAGSDFVEMFVGVGAARVRDMFENAKKNAPCIIFIDEIDAVARQRGAGLGGGHDEREQTLNQMLVEMDGIATKESIIVMAATNRPDILDSAILRPGRFDRQVVVDKPDVKGRKAILNVHIKKQKIPLLDDVNLDAIAKTTPGLSGAELANLVNEAALLAARENAKKVSNQHFELAKDKINLGLERKSKKISEKERKITAYHESGHALCAYFLPDADDVHKITIIPRGMALGVTHTLPGNDKYMYSKTYILAQISVLLGGRVAEMLIFNEPTTGAGNDIKRSTELARKMVCEWGMSDNIGPITLESPQEMVFLGREVDKHKEYSEKVAQQIDDEIRKIVYGQMEFVYNLLNKHKNELENLSQSLLKYETVNAKQMKEIIETGEMIVENNGNN